MQLTRLNRAENAEELIETVKDAMTFGTVWRYLNFPTTAQRGYKHLHLVYEGILPLKLDDKVVVRGDTLCRRKGFLIQSTEVVEPCEGCLNIARGLAIRDFD